MSFGFSLKQLNTVSGKLCAEDIIIENEPMLSASKQ